MDEPFAVGDCRLEEAHHGLPLRPLDRVADEHESLVPQPLQQLQSIEPCNGAWGCDEIYGTKVSRGREWVKPWQLTCVWFPHPLLVEGVRPPVPPTGHLPGQVGAALLGVERARVVLIQHPPPLEEIASLFEYVSRISMSCREIDFSQERKLYDRSQCADDQNRRRDEEEES